MHKEWYRFEYEVYDSCSLLNTGDLALFEAAEKATANAYAPYSHFKVGAAARMENNELVTGGNQENAAFPAGLCAEGVVLATASSKFPGLPVRSLAITYQSGKVENNIRSISPCGICRQSMQEHILRTGKPIRLIMGGKEGKIMVVENAAFLLPFSFEFKLK